MKEFLLQEPEPESRARIRFRFFLGQNDTVPAVSQHWLKGYRKAAGKCPNNRYQPIEQEAELPSGYWQKRGKISISFL
jgi:uncharacterized protein (DUF39 family)